MSDRKFGFICLFRFRPIATVNRNSKKSLTTIDSGAVVTHLPWVQEVPEPNPSSGKNFYV